MPNSKRPAVPKWQEGQCRSRETAQEWDEAGYGVGLLLGLDGLACIDFDVLDPEIADTFV